MDVKKMLAVGAAVVGTVAMADVISSSVVGYTGLSATKSTFYMCASQFDSVGGNGAGIPLCDLIKGEVAYGTQIQIRNAKGTYDIYKYIAECYDAEKDDFVPGWGDVGEELATIKVAPGTAFWFQATADCNVSIAGEILADASKTLNLPAGSFSMISSPYPYDVNPNKLTWTGLSYGDQIQVRNAKGTYDIYKYLAECYDADLDDFVPGWGDVGEEYVTTEVIPVAAGVWIKTANDATMKFESPL